MPGVGRGLGVERLTQTWLTYSAIQDTRCPDNSRCFPVTPPRDQVTHNFLGISPKHWPPQAGHSFGLVDISPRPFSAQRGRHPAALGPAGRDLFLVPITQSGELWQHKAHTLGQTR